MVCICKNLVEPKNNTNLDPNLLRQGQVITNTDNHSAKN